MKRTGNRWLKNASVFILVLIVISSMTILAIGLTYRTRIEMKLANSYSQRVRCYYMALGGIERVIGLLVGQKEMTPLVVAKISQFSNNIKTERIFEQFPDFSEDQMLLTYSLRDERGYYNINKSDPAWWANIKGVEREIIDGILDWIDKDEDQLSEGAETDYYNSLKIPYISKNKPFVALKELPFVRGVTRDAYVGAGLIQKDSQNEKTGDIQIAVLGENEANRGLIEIFTVYGDDGKVNLNTVSKALLSSLQGLGDKTPDMIMNYRAGADGRIGTEDDVFFKSMDDLKNMEGLPKMEIELLGQYCALESEYFRVYSYARSGGDFECCFMATVRCKDNKPEILYLERLM